MITPKLKIIARAISIRLNNGEDIDNIIASYPALTDEEIRTLKDQFIKEV